MDCSAHVSALLAKEAELPYELVDIIRNGSSTTFLAAIASSALDSRRTDILFTHLEPLFAEICARWNSSDDFAKIIPAFGRILHFAPHLGEYAEAFLARLRDSEQDIWTDLEEEILLELLLGVFRILVFDSKSFGKHIKISNIYSGLSHGSRAVRYLTIRVLCVYMHAADAAMENMISKYLGSEAVYGVWEGKNIDYRFFSLWEERRWKDMRTRLKEMMEVIASRPSVQSYRRVIRQADLSNAATEIFGRLLPRLGGTPSTMSLVTLVPTSSTIENVQGFSAGLLGTKPLLLTGLAGAGKTAVVNYCAQQLNKLESMVTLHLNEQSDAKMLVGMYTSGSTPGTFVWRPGALTTAVREGRWVFIEDLDRAPNEIISTLLPLIERGELLIPSRSETVQAARGFKIIATMRTNYDTHGNETMPRKHMIGSRFWQQVPVKMLDDDELGQVVNERFPKLKKHVHSIISVYSRLKWLTQSPGFASAVKTGSARPLTPRDLLKWCNRLQCAFSRTSKFDEDLLDYMFLEAVDCFAGYLQGGEVFQRFAGSIAEELQIDAMRRDHLLQHREIRLLSTAKQFSIGRVTLSQAAKQRTMRRQRFFANSPHTLRLIERLASAVENEEPMLLVGETGIGKTTCVQHLAETLGRKLVSFNLSQQSESGDLLGGFKPVNVRGLIMPLKDEFDDLFMHELSPFAKKADDNARFVAMLGKAIAKAQWKKVCVMWKSAVLEILKSIGEPGSKQPARSKDSSHPKKKQKVATTNGTRENETAAFYHTRWRKFAADVKDLDNQLASKSDAFAFRFVEGSIVKAVRNGDWVLLDEINLATPDTLEALVDLLGGTMGTAPSLLLTEAGTIERVSAHPNFRVFAAMNPATDVGKKDLPPGIRSRFTEIYVDSPDRDVKSLQSIVQSYLDDELGRQLVADVTNLYLEIQSLADSNLLVDGAGQKPHFSLRTLTRTLTYAREVAAPVGAKDGIYRRALYEGFHMSFLTLLDSTSENMLAPKIAQHLFSKHPNAKAEMNKVLPKPSDGRDYVQERHYWLRKGAFEPEAQPLYIITPFVRRNLDNLIRAVSTRKLPILIQGPTSSGKTSMIEYLAKKSGNKFVRINNHEHTDLQEYLGTYVSGTNGKLYFQEGVLVEALRKGHWIVLDELNLAPTDVLEALNRLLDDNRELLIPETQEVVTPHPDFMLFATQNPAGLYGGRKHLSRAFRNRFLELHFDDIPVDELCDILYQRTQIPRSRAQRIVDTYKELSNLRQESRLFEQKSFATLRDLFRWAMREADTIEQLAINGYMLLAERVRKAEERDKVKGIIEDVLSRKGPRVRIDDQALYSLESSQEMRSYQAQVHSTGVVWTKSMRRLFCLVSHALRNKEPVLLVGETGCGKTTVCQMLADTFGKELFIVNAHQNTETGDLIGSQRPIRNRAALETQLRELLLSVVGLQDAAIDLTDRRNEALLHTYDQLDSASVPDDVRKQIQDLRDRSHALFEWSDGALVSAMKTGQLFLLDEISLADDSVLERLNSVLESGRSLLLAEKGSVDSAVTAADGFQFLATMNPGGDYGKKELSPALRNRFTEIWVPSLYDMEDILDIVKAKLAPVAAAYVDAIVAFSQWFNQTYNKSATSAISIRDTLGWIEFINKSESAEPVFAIMHGAAMVYIDTLGANPAAMLSIASSTIDMERQKCVAKLSALLQRDLAAEYFSAPDLSIRDGQFGIGPFYLPRSVDAEADPNFTFTAPTTRSNAMRVFRALQLIKPILIEGNPGVGKTTLVTAVAKALGKQLVRINLSEQTDLMDLFGSDVPVEGASVGSFAWRDAPFLSAMKTGDWVLLDEMNLASQSVLEGLNACLDHRAEAYIAELDQTFKRHPNFRLFAAQNPHHQGGGRKGLPASFVNRFSVVYADVFRQDDLLLICRQVFPDVPKEQIMTLTAFVDQLENDVTRSHRFGAQGNPWEFNLRDTLRWLQLLTNQQGLLSSGRNYDFCDIIFRQRFRNSSDRVSLDSLYSAVFNSPPEQRSFYHNLATDTYQVGLGLTARNQLTMMAGSASPELRVSHLPAIESLMLCTQQNWPVILVGPTGSGKTTVLEHLAAATGANLVSFPMNADIDAMDLVGGYEQADPSRRKAAFLAQAKVFLQTSFVSAVQVGDHATASNHIYLEDLAVWDELPSRKTLNNVQTTLFNLTKKDLLLDVLSLYEVGKALLKEPDQVEKAQFEWVDGLLVQSLERGDWLVLDHANLCSPSVLDRLNSLLEPNGYLSLNEHPMENGQARIVKPHPNFRIFLTMDPRNGELSRAMRNRAIEIFLLPEDGLEIPGDSDVSFGLESSMYRYRNILGLDKRLVQGQVMGKVVEIAADHLSFQDLGLQERFQEQVAQGLVHDPSLQPSIKDSLHLLSTIDAAWVSRNLNSQRLIHLGLKGQIQSIHPLNNSILVRVNEGSIMSSHWLADAFGALLETSKMQEAIAQAKAQAKNKRPTTLFERSVASGRFPQMAGDATIHVASFLDASLRLLKQFVDTLLLHEDFDLNAFHAVKALQRFWWTFFHLVESTRLEDAVYQVQVSLGQANLRQLKDTCHDSSEFLDNQLGLLQQMNEATGLTTGKSMELMWKAIRPQTVSSMARLDALLRLESLADRFDAQIFPHSASLSELCRIRQAFGRTIRTTIVEDVAVDDLIEDLENSIDASKTDQSIDGTAQVSPFFTLEFEAICQYFDLFRNSFQKSDTFRTILAQASLLACRPTKREGTASASPANSFQYTLNSIDRYLSGSNMADFPQAIRQNLSQFLGLRIAEVEKVPLAKIDQVQSELEVLGQLISTGANTICEEQLIKLSLVQQIIAFEMGKIGIKVPYSCGVTESLNLRAESQVWINFALACIFAYVPDRPFDPALKESVERQLLIQRKHGLYSKLQALETFERAFSGQHRNMRYDIAEQELSKLPADAPELQIPRPMQSQLNTLQGEFNAVLQVARAIQESFKANRDVLDLSVVQNISQLVYRLRHNYRAYDDIVVPLVGFLRCLTVGLTLADMSTRQGNRSSTGGVLASLKLLSGSSAVRDFPQDMQASLYLLSQLATAHSVEINGAKARFAHEAHEVFAQLYVAWKDKITLEREKEAKQSSLYAYRGGQDDEEQVDEEEYNELFPNYEEEKIVNNYNMQSPREAAVRIAALHSQIFCRESEPQELITALVQESSRTNVTQQPSQPMAVTLPSLYLSIQYVKDTLKSGTTANKAYNIYSDPNVAEARKLATLVHRIQLRFRYLQSLDFEHATIGDVIRIGDELLGFSHTEPIAKFITKLEKFYEAMNEWERVASKELSASALYDEVTNLIVSWRRLELTTWIRLFDLETDRCVESVKSWWFVAYENIIAVPLQLAGSGIDLKLHSTELLRTLEGFFTSATLGQFQERLRLLVQFREHLRATIDYLPDLTPIYTSLANFIAYYSRFVHPVAETLSKNRQVLEKKVKEVVQLASWKDVNIEALKQSAKSSHRKLFNLVRKFREVLNRPVSGIVEEGPPNEAESEASQMIVTSTMPKSNTHALALCEKTYLDWHTIPSRFKNIPATVSLMRDISSHPQDTMEGATCIRDFLQSLEQSMAHLQKATPSILNKETKDKVKHLKNRKRVLYAETLKELRRMGFQYNLSSDVLSTQDSAALILASIPSLSRTSVVAKDAEYHFHKVLSLMPRVRLVQREHSGDLTAAEVARSTGYLEGVLHKLLRQRKIIFPALEDFEELKEMAAQVNNLWDHDQQNVASISSHSDNGDFTVTLRAMSWLKSVAQVFINVVSAQAELGNFDATTVIDGLQGWVKKLDMTMDNCKALPQLPEAIWPNHRQKLVEQSRLTLKTFKEDIEGWSTHLPMLTPVLGQLLPWTDILSSPTNGIHTRAQHTSEETRKQIFVCIDNILASIQDLSKSRGSVVTSSEEGSWLSKQDSQLAAALGSLRVDTVIASFKSASGTLQALSSEDMQAAASLFAVVQPILQQYLVTFKDLLDRYIDFHVATGKLSHDLCKTFVQIGTKGFCTPPDKAAKEDGENEKLEGGTGLGEGEGAEDISKDIGDDEDLAELAQEPDTKKDDRDEIEDEKDAVDMADEDMEGELGDVEENEDGDDGEGSGDEDEEKEIDEEAGAVDDLGPSTVDEKMWDDGDQEKADKDKEGENGKASKEDEQVAGRDGDKEQMRDEQEDGDDGDEEQDAGADEDEAVGGQEQLEKTDEFLQQEETLDLPDDLNMDGSGDEKSDEESMNGLDDMDESEDMKDAPVDDESIDLPGEKDDGASEADEVEDNLDDQPNVGAEADDGSSEKHEEDADDSAQEKENEGLLKSDANAAEDAVPSEEKGLGTDTNNQQDEQSSSNSAAKQDQGATGEENDNDNGAAGEQGSKGQSEQQEAVGRNEDLEDTVESEPFKKLGDTLERWYNQQRQIRNPNNNPDAPEREKKQDADMADVDFEHLLNEESKAEAQALGAASEDQARALNGENAMETNNEDMPQNSFPDDAEDVAENEDVEMEDVKPTTDVAPQNKEQAQSKSFIGDSALQDRQEWASEDGQEATSETDLQEVDTHLSSLELTLNQVTELPEVDARTLWAHHESSTRTLSATLTEQLRLILAPTLATKLRGDYRTGKRLNIKRIIPYIASSYKRDKIWMRRAVPSKRSYQVMIAVDDSKSMAEGGSKELAFETLALVAKALSLLEVGELCVVGFGEDVKVAHPFDRPFSDEAGVEVFSQFRFQQDRTDVRGLVEEAGKIFEEARLKASSSAQDLWQLMLIVSDAICDDAAEIKRLVRKAQEEKIMIVFVVVDAAAKQTVEGEARKAQSIMDLEKVEFVKDENGELKVKRFKYMADVFPFRWWIVVRDVRELPGVLATALRQWFAEVVESG